LVTGGTGYIGSHTCLELLEAGFDVVIYDNLSNSSAHSVRRVEQLARRDLPLVIGDLRDQARLEATLRAHGCTQVLHFAGLKSVGESVAQPLKYYEHNVLGSLSLLKAMSATGINKLVFSSSATVYGKPQRLPLHESHRKETTNPYGQTKLTVERMLAELSVADPAWSISVLRYFNPVGAHPSGQIGEDPRGAPNNLMPYVAQVAVGKQPVLNVWGDDYETEDGTGVRDYIHVVDLARGHLSALQALAPGFCALNLGTGRGHSVFEVVREFEGASGRRIPYRVGPRRPGDVASCYADPSRAKELLGWSATKTLREMCEDQWRWQSQNPNGYT
jgi:UDP-glucose 4-epimerase